MRQIVLVLFILNCLRAEPVAFAQADGSVARLENIRLCGQFAGGDAGAKISACIADLPRAGGIADARGIEGTSLTIASSIAIAKPVKLLLGAATYTCSANPCFHIGSTGVTIQGINPSVSIIYISTAGKDGIAPASTAQFRSFMLRGPNSPSPNSGLNGGSMTEVVVEDMIIEQWGSHGINTGGFSARWKIHNSIIRNNLQDGIFLGGGTADTIIENNQIYGNKSNGVDINGSNNIVQSNRIYSNGGSGGGVDHNGVLVQAISTGRAPSDANGNSVVGNVISSNAGQGIAIRSDIGYTANYNLAANNIVFLNSGSGGNGDGILIDGSAAGGTMAGNKIIGNNIYSNQRYGIGLDATNCVVMHSSVIGNTLISNGHGVAIGAKVADTTVYGNTALSNTIAQFTDTGLRTTSAGNKVTTADGNYRIDQSVEIVGPFLQIGANSAGSGVLRLPNGGNIYWRDAANSANLLGLTLSSANELIIRGGGAARSIYMQNSAGAEVLAINESGNIMIPGTRSNLAPFVTLGGVTFANLGMPVNGTFVYCGDCAIANPCSGGGTGALAKRLGGVWVCN